MAKQWKLDLNIDQVLKQIRAGAAEGVADGAEQVLATSQRRVPRDSGALARSGEVVVDEAALRATVAYGTTSRTAAYAAIVHERTDVHHSSGEAKFLESALTTERTRVAETIAKPIRRRT